MKNRRTIVIAFLLVAVLTIGVGFAALTDTLTASGSAGILKTGAQSEFEAKVYFSNASTQDALKATAVVDSLDNDKATITVLEGALKDKGDTAVVYLEIKNESDLPVYVTPSISNHDTTHFGITLQYAGVLTGYATIAPGDTLDVGVTVSCIQTPTEDANTSFTITFNATTQAPSP